MPFYNNCLISRALIGLFLSAIRTRRDVILNYAYITYSYQIVHFLTNGILLTGVRYAQY